MIDNSQPPVDDGSPVEDEAELRQANATYAQSISAGTFISGGDFSIKPAPAPATGICSRAEITRARLGFVAPPGYEQALNALSAGAVVVLSGAPATGKRCGALNLLVEMGVTKIRRMSPATSLAALAEFTFTRQQGYVIEGRLPERGDAAERASVEFSWRTMCTAVEEAGAFVVITSDGPPALPPDAEVVSWTPPDVAAVITAHLSYEPAVELSPEDLARLAEACRANGCSPRDVARVVARLREDQVTLDEAMSVLGVTARASVGGWLDAPERVPKEILLVTTLVFVHDAPLRTFESAYASLDAAFRTRRGDDDSIRDADQFEAVRPSRAQADGLVTYRLAEPVDRQLGSTRNVLFTLPEYRAYVMNMLWDRYGEQFWTPVYDWLYELPRKASWGLIRDIGIGAAELMRMAPDDTRPVLDAWACGFARQQVAAALTVNQCALTAESPTVPLQLAIDWSRSPEVRAARTACMAFGGFLGARYPHDAVRELWRSAQRAAIIEAAASGFTALLLLPEENGATASFALKFLGSKLDALANRDVDQRRRHILHHITYEMCSAFDGRTGSPLIAAHLLRRPDDRERVAALWADLLRSRTRRGAALDALYATLRSTAATSADGARDVVAAVWNALPYLEQPLFLRDLTTTIRRVARKDGPTGVVLDILKEFA